MERFEAVIRLSILLLLVLVLVLTLASAENIYNYDTLVLVQNISNGIEIIPEKTSYEVSYVDINLDTLPLASARQEILSETFSPEPEEAEDGSLLFNWNNPDQTSFSFITSSKVKTSGDNVRISREIPFPVTNIPLEFQKYLEETDHIDSNAEIKHTAFLLANGATDLFELEFIFAEWVNKEVTYNLSTLTSEANKPSSWVYENRYGVCDEITNLFISFNRAVGVPARFVSGIAYSDLVADKWGNHGWAEVYFPEVGWVPFDVTYEQYGYVDATHIAMAKNIDGTNPSVRYSTRGHDYDFEPTPIEFTTEIIAKGRELGEKTKTVLGVQENIVGFSSYNLIIAKIENPRTYYVVEEVTLATTEGLTYYNELQKRVLLKPKETKHLYWLVKVDDDLNENYVYTFPVSGVLSKGTILKNSFKVQQGADKYSRLYMTQFLESNQEKELVIDCQAKDIALVNEDLQVACSFTKNEFPITLCLNDNCKRVSSKDDIISLPLPATQVGVHTVIVHSKDDKYQTFVTYKINDMARLQIETLDMPEEVQFDEQVRMEIAISKTSLANPTNVTVSISNGLIAESWKFLEFSEDKQFDLLIDGETLALGKNNFVVAVEFTDNLGKKFVVQRNIQTVMVAKTLGQKITGGINRFSIEVNKLGREASKGLVGEENKNFQQFTVLTITLIILFIVFGIIKSFIHMIKKRLSGRLR